MGWNQGGIYLSEQKKHKLSQKVIYFLPRGEDFENYQPPKLIATRSWGEFASLPAQLQMQLL